MKPRNEIRQFNIRNYKTHLGVDFIKPKKIDQLVGGKRLRFSVWLLGKSGKGFLSLYNKQVTVPDLDRPLSSTIHLENFDGRP